MAASSRTIGHMQAFDAANESVTAYLERFQLFVTVNSIEDDKLVPTLLTVVGSAHYTLLRGLVAPKMPKDLSFDQLKETLKKHFDPEPILIAERFHFYQRNQDAGESIGAYLASLRRLASTCKFGDFLEDALRDRLVCGMLNESIQKVLLTKEDLTLSKAVSVSQGMEAAALKSKELHANKSGPRSAGSVMAVGAAAPAHSRTCGRCGRGNHEPSTCRFRTATCHKCGKVGHIAPVCRSKAATGKPSWSNPKKTKWLDATTEPAPHHPQSDAAVEDNVTDQREPATEHASESLFVVRDRSSSPPYRVELRVNDRPLCMEVDTGAAVSLAPESAVSSLLSPSALQSTDVVLKTYTGESIPVLGSLPVTVSYGRQTCTNLKLLVVRGTGPCLMGRDWLREIRLDWRTVAKVTATSHPPGPLADEVAALQDRYAEVFEETLGTITPFFATLSVKPDTRPKFCKPRPVPFALREKVEAELDRLESSGVLEKTSYSDWAAPVVAVPKRDSSIRLCGDYKVTVNPVLDVDQYPLPKPDDIFASLAGGKLFTTLDLTHAYNQLQLNEESKKYVTINTHKGLYQYTRLPFGIASAPATSNERWTPSFKELKE